MTTQREREMSASAFTCSMPGYHLCPPLTVYVDMDAFSYPPYRRQPDSRVLLSVDPQYMEQFTTSRVRQQSVTELIS